MDKYHASCISAISATTCTCIGITSAAIVVGTESNYDACT